MASTQTTNIHDNNMIGPRTIDTITVNSPMGAGSSITGVAFPSSITTSNGTAPTLEVNQTGTIELRGKNADIRVNGESLMETLRVIQDRLNMLRPNTELESEWDQLRELGEQYRKLEAEFKEKSKMWNTLKK
jgi:hypothetical protein